MDHFKGGIDAPTPGHCDFRPLSPGMGSGIWSHTILRLLRHRKLRTPVFLSRFALRHDRNAYYGVCWLLPTLLLTFRWA